MAEITKILKFTGEEAYINEGLALVARSFGWTAQVLDPQDPAQTIDNPQTIDDVNLSFIKTSMRQRAEMQAKAEATAFALAQVEAVAEASLGSITVTLEDEV